MTLVTVAEAQQRLPELLAAAQAGETVTIRGDDGRIYSLALQFPAPSSTRIGRATPTPEA